VENLFAHDPFREGKVEETLFEAASALLKYVLVNGHAVPASEIEVNAEEGCVRVAYEGEIIESAPILEDPSGEFDRTLRTLRRAWVVKSPPSAIGWRLARFAAGPRPCRPLSVGRDTGGNLRYRLA
jgi:hypothetical protein